MLGWMLRRGGHTADANVAEASVIDQPDTPAPVFAARALRSALFGTPTVNEESQRRHESLDNEKSARASDTPSKSPGILLTPGTATTRRKRVSFGRTSPQVAHLNLKGKASEMDSHAGKRKAQQRGSVVEKSANTKPTGASGNACRGQHAEDSEDDWEEDNERDEHNIQDVTLDLNEPHSQSGRFWKEEFEKYHREAKAEMEKLLKYKQLAKSYAQQKDEAIRLVERLRDEQQKVIRMEKKIAEKASDMLSKPRKAEGAAPTDLVSKLSKQTALVNQYQSRIQDLEEELNELLRHKKEAESSTAQRLRAQDASATAQKALLDVQCELRRAQSQLQELEPLREVSSLKTQLQICNDDRKRDLVSGPRLRDLQAQLRQVEEDSLEKDKELLQIKNELRSLRLESEQREAEAQAVLQKAHTKMADLKKKVRALRAAATSSARSLPKEDVRKRNRRVSSDEMYAKADRKSIVRKALDSKGDHDGGDAANLRRRVSRHAQSEDVLHVLSDQEDQLKPRWRPFVARSPRNRAYLGEGIERRVRNGDTAPLAVKHEVTTTDDIEIGSRYNQQRQLQGGEEDLGRCADQRKVLGGAVEKSKSRSMGKTTSHRVSRSALPPERRAAALEKIEKVMAERRQARNRGEVDKENVRPLP